MFLYCFVEKANRLEGQMMLTNYSRESIDVANAQDYGTVLRELAKRGTTRLISTTSFACFIEF